MQCLQARAGSILDPVVAVLPRLLIALVAHYSYRGIKRAFGPIIEKEVEY